MVWHQVSDVATAIDRYLTRIFRKALAVAEWPSTRSSKLAWLLTVACPKLWLPCLLAYHSYLISHRQIIDRSTDPSQFNLERRCCEYVMHMLQAFDTSQVQMSALSTP